MYVYVMCLIQKSKHLCSPSELFLPLLFIVETSGLRLTSRLLIPDVPGIASSTNKTIQLNSYLNSEMKPTKNNHNFDQITQFKILQARTK